MCTRQEDGLGWFRPQVIKLLSYIGGIFCSNRDMDAERALSVLLSLAVITLESTVCAAVNSAVVLAGHTEQICVFLF